MTTKTSPWYVTHLTGLLDHLEEVSDAKTLATLLLVSEG